MSYYPRYPVRYNNYSTVPYGRRNSRSFTNKRRKKYQKPMRYKVADYGYTAYKMALQLKRTLNVEYKHVDVVGSYQPSWAGYLANLNELSVGDTNSTRDGTSVKMIKLTMRFSILGSTDSILRLIVFNDSSADVTAVSDVLSAINSTNAVNSFKDYDNRFDTKFIHDEKYTMSSTGQLVVSGTIVKDLYLHANYDADTAVPIKNCIRLLIISDRESTSLPMFKYVSRITFVDN